METNEDRPLIVAFVADLMFASKIDSAARLSGFQVRWIDSTAHWGNEAGEVGDEPLGEPLAGVEGELFDSLTGWQPALLLFDLALEDIPWKRWIALLKSSAATRRLPIIAYGPHVDSDRLQIARDVGADAVFPRSRFSADMPNLLQKYALQTDHSEIMSTCAEPLAPLAARGISLFNQGQYYRCHDDLEEAWRQDSSKGRDLYRAILQTGIAYYQIERQNYRGAVKMLLRVRQWLHPLPPVCRGVDVERLRQDVAAVYEALTTAGPEQISIVDRSLFRSIHLVD